MQLVECMVLGLHLRSYKMYKQIKTEDGSKVNNKMVVRIIDNAHIPFDESNTDYQAYLKWVAEGNTPQPAE